MPFFLLSDALVNLTFFIKSPLESTLHVANFDRSLLLIVGPLIPIDLFYSFISAGFIRAPIKTSVRSIVTFSDPTIFSDRLHVVHLHTFKFLIRFCSGSCGTLNKIT